MEILLLLIRNNEYIIYNIQNDFLINTNINTSNPNPKKFKFVFDQTFFLIDENLYYYDDKFVKISTDCLDLISFKNDIYYLKNSNNSNYLIRFSDNIAIEIEYNPSTYLEKVRDKLILISKFDQSTYVNVFDENLNQEQNNWLDPFDRYKFIDNSIYLNLAREGLLRFDFSKSEEKYLFLKESVNDFSIIDNLYFVLENDLMKIFDMDFNLLAKSDFDRFNQVLSINDNLVVSNSKKIVFYSVYPNEYWLFETIFKENYLYLVISLLLISSLLFLSKFLQKNRMLNNVFDLPYAGVILNVNGNGELIEINKLGRKLLDIPESVKKGMYYKSYFNSDGFESIVDVINKALNVKEDFSQKISIKIKRNIYEYLCHITIIRNFAGVFRGIIFNAVDITEELERKRLSNWAQLAHDMQTNLSTIKLNSESLELAENKANLNRQNKINQQVNLLITRVRDIVTVGRSYKNI